MSGFPENPKRNPTSGPDDRTEPGRPADAADGGSDAPISEADQPTIPLPQRGSPWLMQDDLTGRTISQYRILARLGEGGMGVVYKAQDTRLNRPVALKFLSPELTRHPEAKQRFLREARAASALEHPNICTIHEIQEIDNGQMFIAMAYYEGQTLAEKISSAPLTLAESLEIGLQVCRGLAKAHEQGIVHRDIKPENIVITPDGTAKLVDFGLAKQTDVTRLTMTGTTMGTPAYMSPEQARGEAVDHRTDIWSLGAVIYEMLAGRRAFEGDNPHAVMHSILNEDIAPLSTVKADVPLEIEQALMRTLEKKPDKRPQRVTELIEDLEGLRESLDLLPRRSQLQVKLLRRRRRILAVSGASILVLAGLALGVTQWTPHSGGAITSLAVMPLRNLSGDGRQDIFAEGITGELIANFSKLSGLGKVMSRSAVMRYRGTEKRPREIADELQVMALLEGIVQVQEEQVRVTLELVDGKTEEILWSNTFDGALRDVLSLQGEIARAVASEIRLNLTQEEERQLADERPVDPDAYEAYLWANSHYEIWTGERIKKAKDLYEQAIAIDSTFASAYAGLSRIYSQNLQEWEAAERYARKALALNADLAIAHEALGWVLLYRDWDWKGAGREMQEAARLAPGSDDLQLYHFYGLSGHMDKAIELHRKRVAQDPLNPEKALSLSFCYACASRPDDVIGLCRKLLARFPDDQDVVEAAWMSISHAYTMKSMPDSAIAIAEKNGFSMRNLWGDPYSDYAVAGMMDSIRVVLNSRLEEWNQEEKPSPDLAYWIGAGYGRLGEKDTAFDWLEKAYAGRSIWMVYLNYGVGQGELDNLVGDPRLDDLMSRVGMPRSTVALREPWLR